MSITKTIAKLVSAGHNDLADQLVEAGHQVKAGAYVAKVFNTIEKEVTPKQIMAAIKAEGGFDVAALDPKSIEFVEPELDKHGGLSGFTQIEATWRIYPKGQPHDRHKAEWYVWGTVTTGLRKTSKGVLVNSRIYVNV